MALPILAGQILGAAASAIPALIGGANQLKTSREQYTKGVELEEAAKNVKKRALQKEFTAAQNERELMALSGLPTYEAAKQDIEAQTANTLRSIRESSPMGATAAQAIASVLEGQNKNLMSLQGTQGQFKLANRQAATEGMQGLGDIQEGLEKEKRQEQANLRGAAEALLQSSTANKQTGIETIGGSLAPFGKFLGMAASGGMDNTTYGSMTASPQSKGVTQIEAMKNLASNFNSLDEKQIAALMALLTPEQRAALEKIK